MADMATFRAAVTTWAAGGPGAGPAHAQACELAAELPVRTAVLVEGPSDVNAVNALAEKLGRDLVGEGICVLPMGGAMGVGQYAWFLGPSGLRLHLTGLCDEQERDYYARGWARAGADPRDYFLCDADLEDELVRALGVDVVKELIRGEGDTRPLQTFLRQPAQRERTAQQQLRRFFGTKKGRKIHYGRVLVEALPSHRVPPPLAGLFDIL